MAAQRKKNFSEDEKKVLVQLVLEEANFRIINQEGSDNEANKRKRLAWEGICKDLNSVFNNNRTRSNVYEKFSQICSEVKRQHQRRKADSNKTGGGPPPAHLPEYMEQIIDAYASSAKFNGAIGRECGETGFQHKEPRGK